MTKQNSSVHNTDMTELSSANGTIPIRLSKTAHGTILIRLSRTTHGTIFI